MEKIQELRQKREAEINFIKYYYHDDNRDRMSLNLEKYLLKILGQKNKEGKLEATVLEADLLKHAVAYNAFHNVAAEDNLENVEYLLKYRALDYRETSMLLYSCIVAHGGVYRTSLLLRGYKDVLGNLVKAYVNNELILNDNIELYNNRKVSLDTRNTLEQIEYSYSTIIRNRLEKEEELEAQLQFKLSM